MREIVLLQGIPGSGKSYQADRYVQQGYQLVCRDDIRYALGIPFGHLDRTVEHQVDVVSQTMICAHVQRGADLVIDECHVSLQGLTAQMNTLGGAVGRLSDPYNLTIVRVNTPVSVCKKRRCFEGSPFPEKIIDQKQHSLQIEGIPFVTILLAEFRNKGPIGKMFKEVTLIELQSTGEDYRITCK